MKNNQYLSYFINFFLFTSLLLIYPTHGTQIKIDVSSDLRVVDNGEVISTFTGGENIPKFSLFGKELENTTYHVQFSHIIEYNDLNENYNYDQEDKKLPKSKISFANLNWEFSQFEYKDDGSVHFNISTFNFDLNVIFHLEIFPDSFEMKFDVIISSYEFDPIITTSHLALGIKLFTSDLETDKVNLLNEQEVTFGTNGLFSIISTAESYHDQKQVKLSVKDDIIYISYERFDNFLFHDPVISLGQYRNNNEKTVDNEMDMTIPISIITTMIILVFFRKYKKWII